MEELEKQREAAGAGERVRPRRNLNADLIRCVAVWSVLSVHFLLNNGFYSEPVQGLDMLAMCMYRSFFMACVPLFLLLTGFLMWQKTLSKQYYRGLGKTLEIYVLASIACLLYKKFARGESVTAGSALLSVLSFKAANYSWYIEMYIGLFLLIPFLNLMYHGLGEKRQKQALILTMMALTLLPKLVNNFHLTDPGWWLSPGSSTDYHKLVPGFFTAMYPVTYYFIGAYLREYGWPLGKARTLLLLLLTVAFLGLYNYYRSDGGKFVWGSNSTWGGENLFTAVLLFGFLLDTHPDRWPRMAQRLLVYVSSISLGLYLVSWIFDKIVYQAYLLPQVTDVHARWKYYLPVVGCVFLGSAALSTVLSLIQRGLHRAVRALKRRAGARPGMDGTDEVPPGIQGK